MRLKEEEKPREIKGKYVWQNAVSSCPIKVEDVKMLIVLFFNISVCLKSFTS